MAAVHEDGEVGFEEGMLWLPSHVLHEACDYKVFTRNRQQNHQQRHHKLPGDPQSQYSKSNSTSSYQRPKLNGGTGMQAIFLGSGQSSCGTGVFLPQREGTSFQPCKKPACAPVLLPARVIQALNLDVQALGVQISPPPVPKYKPRCGEVYNNSKNSTKRKKDQKDALKQCSVISQSQGSSAEIFLPKEWTY